MPNLLANPLRGRTCASYPTGTAMAKPHGINLISPGLRTIDESTAAGRSKPAACAVIRAGRGRPWPPEARRFIFTVIGRASASPPAEKRNRSPERIYRQAALERVSRPFSRRACPPATLVTSVLEPPTGPRTPGGTATSSGTQRRGIHRFRSWIRSCAQRVSHDGIATPASLRRNRSSLRTGSPDLDETCTCAGFRPAPAGSVDLASSHRGYERRREAARLDLRGSRKSDPAPSARADAFAFPHVRVDQAGNTSAHPSDCSPIQIQARDIGTTETRWMCRADPESS